MIVQTIQVHREPDKVVHVGGTTIEIYAPERTSDAERAFRRKEIAKAVVGCLKAGKLHQ